MAATALKVVREEEEVEDHGEPIDDPYLDIEGKLGHGKKIHQIIVPEHLKMRYDTGIDYMNSLFGGEGLTPSQAILYTGQPGIGKTTQMLELANSWTKKGNVCLLNTGEEAATQLRCTVDRLGLKKGFYVGNDSMTEDVIEHLKFLQAKHPDKQILFIGDSLQSLNDGKYKNGRNSQTPIRVTKNMVSWAKQTHGIAILIGQVTKQGKFIGKEEIRHVVDTHVHFWMDEGKKSETYGKRLIQATKNRYGIANITHMLEMTSKGLHSLGKLGMIEETDEKE